MIDHPAAAAGPVTSLDGQYLLYSNVSGFEAEPSSGEEILKTALRVPAHHPLSGKPSCKEICLYLDHLLVEDIWKGFKMQLICLTSQN